MSSSIIHQYSEFRVATVATLGVERVLRIIEILVVIFGGEELSGSPQADG